METTGLRHCRQTAPSASIKANCLGQKLAAGDFKANTGEIIHDILGAANKVFRDMSDVGDHKKRAKYRYLDLGAT
jgi:hypothetical protein